VGLTGVPSLDWAALAPPLAVVVALLAVLLVDAVRPGARWVRPAVDAITVLGLLAAGLAVTGLYAERDVVRATACVPGGTDVRACSYVVSSLTLAVQALVVAGALGCLLLALNGPGARRRTAHHVLLLAATAGALALAGARDLATLAVALETASLPAIGLVALRRDAQGGQAATTLLLTALGSVALLLLGVSLLYAATGSLHLDRIATVLAGPGLDPAVTRVAVLGVLLAVAGVGFKLSAVPFHLWTPDTYAGAPMPVAAFLAVVSKTAALAGIVLLLAVGVPALADVWAPVVGVVAVLTMTVGNVVALRQRVAVRLLAWSTVAQAGWVLVPLAGARRGTPSALVAGVSASVGYLLAYIAATLAAFAVVVLVARHHPAGEEHTLDAYRGLARSEPVAAAILGFALACLAGLPPGVMGLVAKVVAVRPLVDGQAWLWAVGAALNVALGLAYYVRWAGLLVARPEVAPPRWRVRVAEGFVLGGAGAACLLLSVLAQPVADAVPGILR
jgi:NADH-quinone oxidoreductase subunit N